MPARTDSTQVRVDILDQLSSGVRTLTQSDSWLRWLRVAQRFHRYSFNNQVLISRQFPEATRCAGYRAWQALGRQVDRGEKAIAILAPIRRRADVGDEETVVGFRGTSVFDISQTSGADLPDAPCTRLAGDDPQGFGGRLVEHVLSLGYTVERAELAPGRNGETNFGDRRVRISTQLSEAMAVKTLAHELGHVLLHSDLAAGNAMPRELLEVEAESVAFVVCSGLDVESSAYSFGYVATWTATLGDDRERLIQVSGQRILQAARQILAAVSPEHEAEDAA